MHGRRRARLLVMLLGVLWLSAGTSISVGAQSPPGPAGGDGPTRKPVRHVLLMQVLPHSSPALAALEQSFISTLKAIEPDGLSLQSEYLDLALIERTEGFEGQLVAYLVAKYARAQPDLVVAVATESLRFTMRYRARLFPGVPIVFLSAAQRSTLEVPLAEDVCGVWVTLGWASTLAAARQLQPALDHAVVVTGASPVDRLWAMEARAQLAHLDPPIAVTYLEQLPLDTVLQRVAALPPRSVVLLGSFLTDALGRRLGTPEVSALVSGASAVPVYGLSELSLGHGAVGGHLLSYTQLGQQGATLAARVLRGERPPSIEGQALSYRFDARQLQRWHLDARRAPPGSTVEFESPSLWHTYRLYIAAAVLVLALQSWTIVALLASRAHRRRAQQHLAGQLRFETLISDVLASHLTAPAEGVDWQVRRALARIGEDLDVDRVMLGERDEAGRRVNVTYEWTRDDISEMAPSISWATYPWIAGRLSQGQLVVVSPRRPLPPEAAIDQQGMRATGTRSLLAVPLAVEGTVVGVLSCATVRTAREWPTPLIDRLQLLAGMFATFLARRRAAATARESEERVQQHRQELTHALRVNTLGELGASLAHEINQPLSAILINARVTTALLERGDGGQATISEALADIAADAKRAGEIIARLRALSRKEHVPERGLSLDRLVDEVVALLHQDFMRRGIVVRRTTTPDLPSVAGDRIQLQQIFLNLLVNAGEALERTDRDDREIVITTTGQRPGPMEVAVRDNGIGTRDLDVERMFERFVSTKPGGVGMGLAISRSIVEAHGGRIYAKANADRGLTVYVELPIDAAG